ncbi:hypothetical protein NEOC95_000791 [Neochlamydia sp. AcF95]|nr:hypothetical protein [Neochlamydia sp. AcF95]
MYFQLLCSFFPSEAYKPFKTIASLVKSLKLSHNKKRDHR